MTDETNNPAADSLPQPNHSPQAPPGTDEAGHGPASGPAAALYRREKEHQRRLEKGWSAYQD